MLEAGTRVEARNVRLGLPVWNNWEERRYQVIPVLRGTIEERDRRVFLGWTEHWSGHKCGKWGEGPVRPTRDGVGCYWVLIDGGNERVLLHESELTVLQTRRTG